MGPFTKKDLKRLTGRYGSPLRGGTVLTGRAVLAGGEKDDEDAYGKAGPLREAL